MELLIVWIAFGLVAAVIANSRGRDPGRWFAIGCLAGPFSLVVAVMPSLAGGPSPDTHVRCPDCRELVIHDARACKHCGCRLIPQ